MQRMKYVIPALLILAAGIGGFFIWYQSRPLEPSDTQNKTVQEQPKPIEKLKENEFNKDKYSTTDPNSIWIVVNKAQPLDPSTFMPDDLVVPKVRLRVPGHETMRLRAEAAQALEQMFAQAEKEALPLMLSSAFRSYAYQENLYSGYVKSQGQTVADTQSARPGYSEHQTGLAVDVRPINGECELEQCFGDMAEGKWVAENAHTYGFIIRYTKDNQPVAGYSYEPWHIRYVGKNLAAEMKTKQISTLEEFFGLPAAPDYLN